MKSPHTQNSLAIYGICILTVPADVSIHLPASSGAIESNFFPLEAHYFQYFKDGYSALSESTEARNCPAFPPGCIETKKIQRETECFSSAGLRNALRLELGRGDRVRIVHYPLGRVVVS
jgi:hypothetical protein